MASLAFFFLKNALIIVMIFAAAGHGARNIGELQHYRGPTNGADQNMTTITSSTHDHVVPLAKGDDPKPCCTPTVRTADDRTSTDNVVPLQITGSIKFKWCCTITIRICCSNDTTHSAGTEAFVSGTAPAKP